MTRTSGPSRRRMIGDYSETYTRVKLREAQASREQIRSDLQSTISIDFSFVRKMFSL